MNGELFPRFAQILFLFLGRDRQVARCRTLIAPRCPHRLILVLSNAMSSSVSSSALPEADVGKAARQPERTWLPVVVALLLATFAVLLTSFPVRNLDFWRHMNSGRDLFQPEGGIRPTWLFDLSVYGISRAVGLSGLAAIKSLLCGVLAILLFRLSSVGGWRIALATTGLAVLAVSSRMLLQPQAVSVLLLGIAVWVVYRRTPPAGYWPGWPLFLLFAFWANVDRWFVLGLVVVAAARLGQLLDTRGGSAFGPRFVRWVVSTAVLVAAGCLSPSHVGGLTVPAELRAAFLALNKPPEAFVVHSPFSTAYFEQFATTSTAMAYYPLLALSGLSFLLNRRGWNWGWALPWAVLAVVSGLEARTVPFFAVLAGPIAAWNLQPFFARRASPPPRWWVRFVTVGLSVLVAVAFLVAAWPGWLQTPPYEPRRWAIELPAALERGANLLRQTHVARLWPEGTHTLHVSPDTLEVFGWLCPEDSRRRDDEVFAVLTDPTQQDKVHQMLRDRRVNRVVIWVADNSRLAQMALNRLLANPEEWRVLHVWGGLAVFAWVDPVATSSDRYAAWEVDFDRLGFRPTDEEAPLANGPPTPPEFWEAFWRPAFPPAPPGRFEAELLLRRAEAARPAVPYQNIRDWEFGQLAGLIGAAGGGTWPGFGLDATIRLSMIQPPSPTGPSATPLPLGELATLLQQQLAAARGAMPLAEVYAAVRAARRGVAENPTDAKAHLTLAQAYLNLMENTSEKRWSDRDGVNQVRRVREVQAIAALNNAIRYNRRLAPAHLALAQLYRRNGCLDLAAEHLQEFRSLPPHLGGPPEGELTRNLDTELNALKKEVASRKEMYDQQAGRASVADRALTAVQLQLGGLGRDILLNSDVSAFGAQGVELEVDLLLRTGRPRDVLTWTTPEVGGSLGDQKYYWTLAQAHLAVGDYESADRELTAMIDAEEGPRTPTAVGDEVAAVVGKSVLDGFPSGGQLNQHSWQTLSLADLQNRVSEIARTLILRANMSTLRGLVALEAGNTTRAREAFTEALVHTPNHRGGGGQVDFGGRRLAVAGLEKLSPPAR